jgi:hypothetical protein
MFSHPSTERATRHPEPVTLPSRLAALTLCTTFLIGQPTVVCDLACAIQGHWTLDVPAGTMVIHSHHGPAMQCHAHQVRTRRVPPAALVVSTSLPVAIETLPFPAEASLVGWLPAAPLAASASRAVDPPPPRLP